MTKLVEAKAGDMLTGQEVHLYGDGFDSTTILGAWVRVTEVVALPEWFKQMLEPEVDTRDAVTLYGEYGMRKLYCNLYPHDEFKYIGWSEVVSVED